VVAEEPPSKDAPTDQGSGTGSPGRAATPAP